MIFTNQIRMLVTCLTAFGLGLVACQDPESQPRERKIFGERAAANAEVESEVSENAREELPNVDIDDQADSGDVNDDVEDVPANGPLSDAQALQLAQTHCANCHIDLNGEVINNPESVNRLALAVNAPLAMPPNPAGFSAADRKALSDYISARTAAALR